MKSSTQITKISTTYCRFWQHKKPYGKRNITKLVRKHYQRELDNINLECYGDYEFKEDCLNILYD